MIGVGAIAGASSALVGTVLYDPSAPSDGVGDAVVIGAIGGAASGGSTGTTALPWLKKLIERIFGL